MKLYHLALGVASVWATAILAACGGSEPTLVVQPMAAASASPASGVLRATTDCDAGRWAGAISPEGRPDSLDAGDAGAVYVWHDADGWHARATDRQSTDHHYTGTIRLSRSAAFVDVRPVRDERDDRVTVDADNVLHYDFHTFASVDGVDFRVSCPGPHVDRGERQRLEFHTEFDGRPVADRIRIGDSKRSPKSADFGFVRVA